MPKKQEERAPILLAQANALTQAKYDFSVIEKRCLYQIIRQVRSQFIENDTGQRDLFDNLIVKISPEMLAECSDSSNITKVYQSLIKLNDRKIEVDNDNEWFVTQYINYAKHNKKANVYEVEVSRLIMPYLVQLAGSFTSYDLTVALSLQSQYSQRFYEFCCQYKNRPNKTFFLDVDRLREMLMLEDKYPNIAHLRIRVIDVAQKELKEAFDKGASDLWFDYRVKDTQGRKILSFFFEIYTKENLSSVDYNNAMQVISRIRDLIAPFFPRDTKFVSRVITAVQLNPSIGKDLLEKITIKINDYSRKDIPPVIRFILREDYGIK
jgi:plasmid replication initiation protein